MKIINNNKYSRKSFDGYKLRVKIEIIDNEGNDHNYDIYTTQTHLQNIRTDLNIITTDKAKWINIIHTSTKEQDDLTSEMIGDLLDW